MRSWLYGIQFSNQRIGQGVFAMATKDQLIPLEPALAERLMINDRLPSMPAVVIELLELSRDPETNVDDLVKVVRKDPTSAARLVRRANSSYYGRRTEVETLKDAVVFLGLNDALTTAFALTLVPVLRRDPLQGLDYEHFWRRSVISAAAGQLIGASLLKGQGELLFLAGLLQDFGMLALQRIFPGTYVMDLEEQKDHRLIQELEKRKLSADHSVIGAWVLQQWGLPTRIVRAVAASHEPTGVVGYDDDPGLMNAIAATGVIADLWLLPGQGELSSDVERLTQLLDCDVREVFDLANVLDDQVAEVVSLFQMDLGGMISSSGLIEQLNKQVA
jgi:HD-like signal output (HDOD) protein